MAPFVSINKESLPACLPADIFQFEGDGGVGEEAGECLLYHGWQFYRDSVAVSLQRCAGMTPD